MADGPQTRDAGEGRDAAPATGADGSAARPAPAGPAPSSPQGQDRLAEIKKQLIHRGIPLVVAGVSFYLLYPSLLKVAGSWRSLAHLAWPFAILTFASEFLSYFCIWELNRIALGTRAWFPVVSAQLAGNAVGRIVPGGGATFTAVASDMLCKAGYDRGEAVAALAASSSLQAASTFGLVVLALPAIVGGAGVAHSLATAAYLGAFVFVLLVACGIVAFKFDRPLALVGRGIEWVANHTVRRKHHISGVSEKLLAERDAVKAQLGERWKEAALASAGSAGFDYLALLCALRAVGADPRPSLVLLAYLMGELLALVPFTPGGIGFVEVGLAGTLKLAGVSGADALTATLLYRIAFFWLPLPAGGIAYVLFQRRYGRAA